MGKGGEWERLGVAMGGKEVTSGRTIPAVYKYCTRLSLPDAANTKKRRRQKTKHLKMHATRRLDAPSGKGTIFNSNMQ